MFAKSSFPPGLITCFDPLADIRWAIQQRDSASFASPEEPYTSSIRQPHFFQVNRYLRPFLIAIEKLSQFRYVFFLDSAAEREDRAPIVFGSPDLQHVVFDQARRWPLLNC